jgi:DNA-binding LacI/PurR family transcriptional regulator
MMNQDEAPQKKATIYDVAAEAGVSKSLVSLVLRGEASVSDSRREAVYKAINKLNYRPSKNAQNLASNRSKTIGLIITEYENLSYVSVLTGLREVFDSGDYRILITDLHTNPNLHGDAVDALVSMDVEALVFIVEPGTLNTEGLTIPSIMIGERETLVKGADLVFSDDRVGTELVVDHLMKLGHKNIAHLSGLGGIARNRRKSYVTLMKERGLKAIVFGESKETNQLGGYLAAKELIASKQNFTAIYAANDYIAAGAISALTEHSIRVPEDVSVVGYDNAPISREYALRLTTVDDMGVEIGRKAAKQLLKHIESGQITRGKQILIEPALVVRKSTLRKVTLSE